MSDLDKLDAEDLVRLAEDTIASWAERDTLIDAIDAIKRQSWAVPVPEPFMHTAQQVHNSLSKEIPTRVAGVLSLRRPTYQRLAPSDDVADTTRAEMVERYCTAADAYYAANSLPAWDAYEFAMSQLVDTGACVVSAQLAPHAWAAAPPLLDDKGDIVRDLWRDRQGEPTEDWDALDLGKTAAFYENLVEAYRQNARPPIVRRFLQTRQSYPLYLLDSMAAMFIKREVTPLELEMQGFDSGDMAKAVELGVDQKFELLECWTPNRARYFWQNSELRHRKWGSKGITTNYGFVPFSYRTGIAGGKPVLWLVESQIKLLDTLDTFRLNAIHLASFPTYKFRYNRDAKSIDMFTEAAGKDVVHYQIHTGEINDFGPDKEIAPLEHPGMNMDFDKLREKVEESIDKIIPRTLRGEGESSGYNTLQVTAQAKAIFRPLFTAAGRMSEDVALFDLRIISRFLKKGGIYLHYAHSPYEHSRQRRLERVRITADDIRNYYQISAQVDEELDRITLGSWAAKMNSQGYGWVAWVEDLSGIPDSAEAERQRAKDRVMRSPEIQKMQELDAIKHFGLLKKQRMMRATARIQEGEDGMPRVAMADGALFGPQTPEMQGAAGAMLGGLNLSAAPGNPNLDTIANPEALLPRDGQPMAFRKGGGAIPGAAQLQNLTRPTPKLPI